MKGDLDPDLDLDPDPNPNRFQGQQIEKFFTCHGVACWEVSVFSCNKVQGHCSWHFSYRSPCLSVEGLHSLREELFVSNGGKIDFNRGPQVVKPEGPASNLGFGSAGEDVFIWRSGYSSVTTAAGGGGMNPKG